MQETGWKKRENENGFPFYVNETGQHKQWDHPKFTEIRHLVDDCNYVKYSKYRLALKFRVLQKALFTEGMALSTVQGVFQKHQLGANESSFCLESYDLEAVLYDIYFAAAKINNTDIDVDLAVELMQNFLYNIYDNERQGKIQVSAIKLVLGLLSSSEIPELYQFVFGLASNHNNCLTRLRFQALLLKFMGIINFMHEDVSFGQHLIPTTIESCFSNSPGLVGIAESGFIAWLDEAPPLLCWMSILHRIKASEYVVHASKCATCKASPLVGLRYACTKCLRYNQCQRCFFMGQVNHSHKLTHSMREYSTESDPKEFTFRFIRKLCSLMPCRVKFNNSVDEIIETKSNGNVGDETACSPQGQLQGIIKRLEAQNRELQKVLGSRNEQEIWKYLEEHKAQISAQIRKLKLFRDSLQGGQFSPKRVESTPMVAKGGALHRRQHLGALLSPIAQCESVFFGEEQPSKENYSLNDISTWINKGGEEGVPKSPVRAMHNDLDEALDKLQQILANNFTLDESLGNSDNSNLKIAVSEVEDMLTSFIDTVENSRANSALPKQETEALL